MGFVDEVPVPVSEDWADWLGYARALSEVGDPRGEAIRLEHRGASADDAQLAAVYRQVEHECGLDGLRADGSWRLGWLPGSPTSICGWRATSGSRGPTSGSWGACSPLSVSSRARASPRRRAA
ncbi:hypothetical protein [Kitasatospora purpeofusca]|uniref:hypothetical protein n=1 Tax=Kitasatospora purpeofusca TaxID=67352 RepID=UPI003647863D